jgi:hemerythrin-like domain-containing protein
MIASPSIRGPHRAVAAADANEIAQPSAREPAVNAHARAVARSAWAHALPTFRRASRPATAAIDSAKEAVMARSGESFDLDEQNEIEDDDAPAQDAVSLLTADHAEVRQMFETYRQLVDEDADDDQRRELARRICSMLTVHSEIEEEIFYPSMRENIDDELMLDEAEVEHAAAKDLIEQIESMDAGDALYDARVIVLGEYVEHHVQEEENEIFPQAEKSGIDLDELGVDLASRRRELMATFREE